MVTVSALHWAHCWKCHPYTVRMQSTWHIGEDGCFI